MYTFQGKDKPYFDGYEWMIGVMCRADYTGKGWGVARDSFNARFPHDWKPKDAEEWQFSKGAMAALEETM